MARSKQKFLKSTVATALPGPAAERPPGRKWHAWMIPAALTVAAVALSLQQIDLTIVDLGRHLRNGEIILTSSPEQRAAVLHTNYYSYTNDGAPFVNHHWLSGVVFFLVWKLASFEGLSIFYAVLTALAVVISYLAALKFSHWTIAAPLMALALPNIVWRAQVRPEVYTSVLAMVYYAILLAWFRERLSTRWVFALLPPLTILWVNLHVGFVFGFVLLGMFGLKLIPTPGRLRGFAVLTGGCLAAGVLNPSGIAGLLQPLSIFGDFGYPVAELMSLGQLRARGQWWWQYNLFLLLAAAPVAFALWRWLSSRKSLAAFPWPEMILLTAVGILSILSVRNIPIYCLLLVPVLSETIARAVPFGVSAAWLKYLAASVCAAGLLCALQQYSERARTAGIGLLPGVNATAEFLRNNGIHGPIWNDPDIGGYLIFHRFDAGTPSSGVFVDMRPEAYPGAFFTNTYIPMVSGDDAWKRVDSQYRFNALVFSLQDAAFEIETSILTRVRDPQWAPVYTDYYSLVFLRRTPENADVIARHLIPREVFR